MSSKNISFNTLLQKDESCRVSTLGYYAQMEIGKAKERAIEEALKTAKADAARHRREVRREREKVEWEEKNALFRRMGMSGPLQPYVDIVELNIRKNEEARRRNEEKKSLIATTTTVIAPVKELSAEAKEQNARYIERLRAEMEAKAERERERKEMEKVVMEKMAVHGNKIVGGLDVLDMLVEREIAAKAKAIEDAAIAEEEAAYQRFEGLRALFTRWAKSVPEYKRVAFRQLHYMKNDAYTRRVLISLLEPKLNDGICEHDCCPENRIVPVSTSVSVVDSAADAIMKAISSTTTKLVDSTADALSKAIAAKLAGATTPSVVAPANVMVSSSSSSSSACVKSKQRYTGNGSDTLHFSNIPGPFAISEVATVAHFIKGCIEHALKALNLKGKIVNRNVVMREGRSTGYAFFTLNTPDIAMRVHDYLKENSLEMETSIMTVYGKIKTSIMGVEMAVSNRTISREESIAIQEARALILLADKNAREAERRLLIASKKAFPKLKHDSFIKDKSISWSSITSVKPVEPEIEEKDEFVEEIDGVKYNVLQVKKVKEYITRKMDILFPVANKVEYTEVQTGDWVDYVRV